MSSPEDKAYEIMRELDVNYVLVIFGGLTGYASDGKQLPHYTPCLAGVTDTSSLSRYQQVSVDGPNWGEHGERESHQGGRLFHPPGGI